MKKIGVWSSTNPGGQKTNKKLSWCWQRARRV